MASEQKGGPWVSIAVVAVLVIGITIWSLGGDDEEEARAPTFLGGEQAADEQPTEAARRMAGVDDPGVTKSPGAAPTTSPTTGDLARARQDIESGSSGTGTARTSTRSADEFPEPPEGVIAVLEREFAELPPPEVLAEMERDANYLPPQAEIDSMRAEQEAVVEPSPAEIQRMRREAELEPSSDQLRQLIEQAERDG